MKTSTKMEGCASLDACDIPLGSWHRAAQRQKEEEREERQRKKQEKEKRKRKEKAKNTSQLIDEFYLDSE